MLLLAATAIEKMQAVPAKVWINLSLGIPIFVAATIILRKVAQMNKTLMWVVVFVVITSVSFNWIYARNEPKFMTPIIEKIAAFFPSAEKKASQEKKIPGP